MAFRTKHILIILALAAFFLAAGIPALALELNYPAIPGAQANTTYLPEFIRYAFLFIIASAGGIGVLSFAWAGFQWVLSGFSAAQKAEANKRIFDAAIGIILLLTSVVLLGTINNELTVIQATPQNLNNAVYLIVKVPEDKNHPTGEDYKLIPPSGISNITSPSQVVYRCNGSENPTVMLTIYQKANFVRGNERVEELGCGEKWSVSSGSISWMHKSPGVYFYTSTECGGAPLCSGDGCSLRNDGNVPWGPNRQYPRSFKIVSGQKETEKFGVVLEDQTSECSIPYTNNGLGIDYQFPSCKRLGNGDMCCNIQATNTQEKTFQAEKAYILQSRPSWDPNHYVTLYSPHYAVDLEGDFINTHWSLKDPITGPHDTVDDLLADERLHYIWNEDDAPTKYKDECTPNGLNPCLEGVEMAGDYYIIAYGQSQSDDSANNKTRRCRVFTKPFVKFFSEADLKLGPEYDLYDLHIIPYGGG